MGFDSYTPVADIAVIAVCSAVFILLATSYVNRTRSFHIFSSIVGVVFLAAMVNIGYHMLLAENLFELRGLIYTLRVFYHSLLFDVFFLFILYTTIVSDLERKKSRTIVMISSGLFVAVVGLDVLMTIIGIGFRIGEDGIIREGSNVFLFGYTLFFILLV
ncbi:MAG: hypothetical protein J6X61_00975, partial [Clostridia bacterium]|nr:hypothetical protein [Clostridia bacterium]